MKIGHLPPSKVDNTTPQSETEKISKTKVRDKQVKTEFVSVDFSDTSKIIKKAIEKSKELPEIRKDKVDAIKAKLKNSSYSVTPEQIAEKMLEEIMEEIHYSRK